MINLIVCMGENKEIGYKNDMPWGRELPEDLAYFRKITVGHAVVMGRKTYESIGHPLPDRENVILTKDKTFTQEGCLVFNEITSIVAWAKTKEEDVFIVGGATLYEQFLPYADQLFVTKIEETFEADTYFPNVLWEDYELVSSEKGKKDAKNNYDYYFYLYKKV